MNKKIMLSVAATAALLMSSPLVNKADAASNCPTGDQVQITNQKINIDQVNSLLQKYIKDFNINLQTMQPNQAQVAQQPKENVQAPAKPAAPKQAAPAPEAPKPAPATPAPAPNNQPAAKPEQSASPQNASAVSAFEQKVVELTNQERAKQGLSALKLDTELSKVAREKSKDMQAKGYFSHTSPTYGSPFDMMKKFGITYRSAGENIAMGQRTPEEVVKAWMNSEGHRANILNQGYTHIGVGYVEQGNYWTQMFISK